jgi:Transposase DDE domain
MASGTYAHLNLPAMGSAGFAARRFRAPSSRVRGTWPATSGKATMAAPRDDSRKKVEILFAHLKRILRLDRLRLRGPNGARDEFLLAASVQNLRKLAKLIPDPTPSAAS